MKSKVLNAMWALSKFLVLLAIFLSTSSGYTFVNHARLNHLIRFDASMSNTTNEPSCVPTGEPTKRTELSSILSTKSKLIFTCEKTNGCQQLTHAADSEGVTLALLDLPCHKYVGIQQMSLLLTNNSWQCRSFVGNMSIDSWQCRMEIDKVNLQKSEPISSHSTILSEPIAFGLTIQCSEPIVSHSHINREKSTSTF
jgi:hypothetical protein